MEENIIRTKINEFLYAVGDYVEAYNLDILIGLVKLTNSIEKSYEIYKNNITRGFSLLVGNKAEDLKKDILYRFKYKLPIQAIYEKNEEIFVDTVDKLEGEELEYYLKMNGYSLLPTGIALCIAQ